MTRREEIARELDNRLKNKRKNEISAELDRRLAEREKEREAAAKQRNAALALNTMSKMTGGTSMAPSSTAGTAKSYSPLMERAGKSVGVDFASRDKSADDAAVNYAISKIRADADAEAKAKEEKEAAAREAVINYDTEVGKKKVVDYENKLTDLYKRQDAVDAKIADSSDERSALHNEKISMKLKDAEKNISDDLNSERKLYDKALASRETYENIALNDPKVSNPGFVTSEGANVEREGLISADEAFAQFNGSGKQEVKDMSFGLGKGTTDIQMLGFDPNAMTNIERYTYSYYLERDPEKADKYLEIIKPEVNARTAKKRNTQIENMSKQFPIAGAAMGVMTSPVTAPLALIDQGISMVTGKESDPNGGLSALAGATDAAKEGALSTIDNDVIRFFASAGMSAAENLIQTVMSGGSSQLARGMMSVSAASSAYREAKLRGASNEQALIVGVVAGIAEYVAEKIPTERLLKTFSGEGIEELFKGSIKRVLPTLAKEGLITSGSEFVEELTTEEVNKITDAIVMGDKSNYNATKSAYIENGDDESTAARKAFMQNFVLDPLLAGASGAVAGGGMHALGTAVNAPTYAAIAMRNKAARDAANRSPEYLKQNTNKGILSLIEKVKSKSAKANDKVYLDNVTDDNANRIQELTGVDVHGFKVAIEARQIEHILIRHGENGAHDNSMSDVNDIAKIEYALNSPDKITKAGKAQGYSYTKNGRNKTADTVLYEKSIGNGSYYVVQAVADTKAKTLHIVSAFIGKSGFNSDTEASQLIDAKSPNVTSGNGSAITSGQPPVVTSETPAAPNVRFSDAADDTIIPQSPEIVKGVDNATLTKDMSELAVKALKSGVEAVGEDGAADYAADFRSAYHAGRIGVPLASVSASSVMSEPQREAAYNLGMEDGKAAKSQTDGDLSAELAKDAVNAEPEAEFTPKGFDEDMATETEADTAADAAGTLEMFEDSEGILTDEELEAMYSFEREAAESSVEAVTEGDITIAGSKSISSEELKRRTALAAKAKTDTRKSGIMEGVSEKNIKQAEFLSKVFGRKVLFYSDSYRVNGKTKDGIIYVNAKKGSITSQILAHELTHTAELAKQYGQLYTAVKKLYIAEGIDWDTELDSLLNDKTYIKQYKSDGREFTKTDAEHELVARKIEEIFNDDAKLEQFVKDNRNWATRALAWLRNKIRGFADVKLDADEFEVLQLMRDVEKRLAKALRDTKGTSKDAGKGVQYMMDSDSKSAQGDITAAYQKTVDAIINGTHKGNSAVLLGYTPQIFEELGAPSLPFVIGVGHVYSIAVSEAMAKIDGRYNKNTNYHGLGVNTVKDIYSKIQDPLMVIAAKDVHNKKGTAPRDLHSVVAIIDVGKGNEHLLMPVEISAISQVDGQRMDVNILSTAYERNVEALVKEAVAQFNTGETSIYYMKKEATALLGDRVRFPRQLTDAATSSGTIIRRFDEKINMSVDDVTKSLQFAEWFGDWQNHPDKSSKVVNADGTPKEMYHGTNEEFTVFDRTKGKKKVHLNVLGDGNYFTERKEGAEHYGERVVDAYLSIKNPYIFKSKEYTTVADQIADEYGINRDSFKGSDVKNFLKGKNFDGVLLLDADGEVIIANAFDSTQIKSATDNIGTFDKSNPDIRYSLATDEQLRKQAIKMLQDGVSAKQVYEETGFFIDNKGRIRNDIDDVNGKDPAIRKPYPVEDVSKVKAEAREKLEAEREQHKKELAYNRQYWQAENQKAKEKVSREYAERDARRNALREEAKAKKRAEKERRKRARGGYISIEKIRTALENNTFVKEMEKQWSELRELEKAAEVYASVNLEEISPELQEEIRELRNKVEDKRVYINKVGQQKRKVMRMKALEMLRSGNIELWKDKKAFGGLRYSVNTMLRNVQDISKGDALGKAVYEDYFAPIGKHVAEATKLKNDIRARVADLGLSTTVRKGDVLSESAFVQLLGEARDSVYALENDVGHNGWHNKNKTRNGRTLAEWQDIITTLMVENPSISKNPEAMKRVDNAIEEFKKIYDDLFKSLNKVRIYNGYAPIEYRHGYFPHFSSDTSIDSVWSELCDGLNFKIDTEDLPTTINGLTSRFKPGMQYQTFDKARSDHVGEEYNNIRLEGMGAVEGIDRYIEVAANVIYLTEDIQKLRALSEMIRYNSDKDGGIKDHIDNTRKRTDISEDEKQILIDAYLATNPEKSLSNFVVHLEEYTNLLAGKKSFYDRAVEQMIGRGGYAVAKKIEGKIAGNMVALNPKSWLTNFIPLTYVAAVTGNARTLLAASQTVKAVKHDDGFVARSSFLTNRRGSDRLIKGKLRAVADTFSSPMGWIDNFTAETVVRARYNENIAKGMSESEAMTEADTFAAGLMGDRSLGATPTIFSQSNPVTKLFTQFQLEVANQIGFVFKDLPRLYEKDKRKLAAALVKMALYSFLYNFLYKGLTGRDAAADPIGVLNDVSGDVFGVALPDLRDFFTKGFTPELFKTENYGQWKDVNNWQEAAWKTLEVTTNALGTVTEGTLEQLPFTSALGLLFEDFDQGRLPISSAVPNIPNVASAVTDFSEAMQASAAAGTKSGAYKKFVKELYDEFITPISYVVLPFGAGQVKNTLGTVDALAKGGSYTYDAEGNRELQYPVYTDEGLKSVGTAAKGLVFGKTATSGGQAWIEGGLGSLSAKKTAMYERMVKSGVTQRDAFEAVSASDNADALYEVVMSGDSDKLKLYKLAYESESAYNSVLREGLRNNDSRIMEAIEANINGDITKRTKIYKEIVSEGYFDLGVVTATVNNATTYFNKAVREAMLAKAAGNESDYNKQLNKLVGEQGYSKELVSEKLGAEVVLPQEETDSEPETYSMYTASDIGTALDSGDGKLAKEIIADLIDTKVKNGADEKKARSSVKSSITSYYKELYLAACDSGNYREKNRILDALLQSGLYGKNRTEVKETLTSWEKAHKEK